MDNRTLSLYYIQHSLCQLEPHEAVVLERVHDGEVPVRGHTHQQSHGQNRHVDAQAVPAYMKENSCAEVITCPVANGLLWTSVDTSFLYCV